MAQKKKTKAPKKRKRASAQPALAETDPTYEHTLAASIAVVEHARQITARAVNAVMTAAYWELGRYVVEAEQKGQARADYGREIVQQLARDLTARFGRSFGARNLWQIRRFHLLWPILQTPSAESSGLSRLSDVAARFPLPWSAYVRLMSVDDAKARAFYETEALRGGWSVRQLDRQINSQFYQRTLLSRKKAEMLLEGATNRRDGDALTPEEEIKDPFLLEFLDLEDKYSESDLEEALIRHLETFLLELGGDFTFAGRQRRLRIGDTWYRVDLVFYHRRLRCLVLIDLKLGRLDHADVGQMQTYLSFARQHWTHEDENPPVGLILCADTNEALARYALDGATSKILAARYQTTLPSPETLERELAATQHTFQRRLALIQATRTDSE